MSVNPKYGEISLSSFVSASSAPIFGDGFFLQRRITKSENCSTSGLEAKAPFRLIHSIWNYVATRAFVKILKVDVAAPAYIFQQDKSGFFNFRKVNESAYD